MKNKKFNFWETFYFSVHGQYTALIATLLLTAPNLWTYSQFWKYAEYWFYATKNTYDVNRRIALQYGYGWLAYESRQEYCAARKLWRLIDNTRSYDELEYLLKGVYKNEIESR